MTYFSYSCTMQLSDTLALVGGLSVLWNLLRLLWRCWRGFRQYILSQFWQVDLRGYGQWAVPVNQSVHLQLARRGLDIVLVSRSEDKLQTAAKVIEEIYGRKTCTIRVDFTDGHIIYPKIANVLKDLEVGILGMSVSDTLKKITNIVNCNMLSIAQDIPCGHCLSVFRGHGLIINISSETGVRPHPLVSLYSATKLFVTYFSQCLHAEYKSKGIIVQCVTPLLVSTSMTRHTPVNCFTKSAQGFANEALNTVGYSAYTSGCLSHALQSLTLTVLLPDWLRMSSFFIRQLRKTSDVSPCENNKQKILEKDE
uniref:Uncharacterized protein n=1 Tax=Periophthalmus magnuspinnatus TaxID=409849 RepID=A0A3B3ZFI2_9GOBI